MIEKFKNSKAFTLIELIVVVGVIGILVLIASSSFSNQTEKAKHNAALADMRIVADATDMYNIDNDDWPRLTDEPYTADELEAYSESFYDATGKKANLDSEGKYYDIDYDKLNQYAKAPVNKENYILQNPAGKVFYMRNLTSAGKERVDYGQPSTPAEPEEPALYEFTSHTFTNAGQAGRFGPTQSMLNNAYKGLQVEGHVTSDNGIQLWTVPKTGTYRIEAHGAQGGKEYSNFGGKGAIVSGTFNLALGEKIRILVGQSPGSLPSLPSTRRSAGGGGGTFVVKVDPTAPDTLWTTSEKVRPLIIGGGGGGASAISLGNMDASPSTSGKRGGDSSGGAGGINGQGGNRGNSSSGGSGGGWHSGGNAGAEAYSNYIVAPSFLSGGIGGERHHSSSSNYGSEGGFGSGGGGWAGGAGGGGYSGGGSGSWVNSNNSAGGGGGGSFNSGENQANSVGNTGHGKVIITYIKE